MVSAGNPAEATEVAETIHGGHDHGPASHGPAAAPPGTAHAAHEAFRKLTGIYLGVVAMLLSIATLGGSNATKEMLSANIHASDTYAYYQAKYLRQTSYQIAAEQLELMAADQTALPPAAASRTAELVKRYRDIAARYESEPDTGDGKKELTAKAKAWEQRRDEAAARDPNFDFAVALFQIAIVLGSVSIVAASRLLLVFSSILVVCASLLTLNGYFLFAPLPG
ncbi:MAG: DUF4337 domain-containing protein [Alphaproteobacteria bacterium]|nr:DUF4337 domain-containing protein [Alphaproteobacteria bacterium]